MVFPLHPLRGGATNVLNELFTIGELSEAWHVPSKYFILPVFMIMQFFLAFVFIPSFVF
jgi:hypothetical protein